MPTLSAAPVSVCVASPSLDACRERLGSLSFIRGSHLTTADARFGGFSSAVPLTENLAAVSDLGWWAIFPMRPTESGANVSLGSLHSLAGEPIGLDPGALSKEWADAEGLAQDDSGNFLVSFERQHRVWRYSSLDALATDLNVSRYLTRCAGDGSSSNSGVEALELLNATHYLAICEAPAAGGAPGFSPAFVFSTAGGEPAELRYELHDELAPVDLARLPADGTRDALLLVLERSYIAGYGNRIRVRRLMPHDVGAAAAAGGGALSGGLLAELTPDLHAVDNFEGLVLAPSRSNRADAGERCSPPNSRSPHEEAPAPAG